MTPSILAKTLRTAAVAVAGALMCCCAAGCDRIDDTRIPAMPVNIAFTNVGMWNTYGVGGALDVRRFIRTAKETVPANFPYTASTYTGYGGVLLACDYNGNPVAYDLACPVECRSDVRVAYDETLLAAVCPVCHSAYFIFENYGHPMSGIAAEKGYGLRRYSVMPGAGDYYVITR